MTYFASHHVLYIFIHIPFGLKNAPATFQRSIYVLLVSLKGIFALLYLEYSIVFSNNTNYYIKHFRGIVNLLKDAEVTMKLKKFHFFQTWIDYLGHVINAGSLKVARKRTDALEKLKNPRIVAGLRSSLGI